MEEKNEQLEFFKQIASRLDWPYLDKWARPLGLDDLLAKARTQ